MAVYEKEKAACLSQAIESIRTQTIPADEVVLVKDGDLTESLENAISRYTRKLRLRVVAIPHSGLHRALQVGVASCEGDWIARMDSDDVSVPRRFEMQIEALKRHPDIDVIGGAIAEFTMDPLSPHVSRRPPPRHDQIAAFARRRNPLNHMTVMFRRDAVLRAGNYQRSPGFEDWHLWARMIQAGSRFMNLEEVLVLVRVGSGMFERRSGLPYIRQEISFHRDMYKAGFFSSREVLRNLAVRIPVRLTPGSILQTIYTRALRSPVEQPPIKKAN